jgi:hypothetical protein
MDTDDILEQLAQLPPRVYSYVALVVLIGPLVLRLFGFGLLAQFARPLALVVLIGGIYAKRQRGTSLLAETTQR